MVALPSQNQNPLCCYDLLNSAVAELQVVTAPYLTVCPYFLKQAVL
ncbi:hypothetical protein L798_11066 [Zootermopsis nevadensis]|uniref:Uncharacterized protein n=1 Tax=Zootermopsis nevadensis TaxID=136037 RepID=A0A067R001_ZOONE|nr:hypothetical protein L798_11066 [Zootermopsis nevadensis]